MKKLDPENDTLWRVYLIYTVMLLFGIAVVFKIIYIQVAEREELLEYAKKYTTRIDRVAPARGNLLSKNNKIIATTIPVYKIHFDPVAVPDSIFGKDIDKLADSLSVLIGGKTKQQYVSALTKARKTNKCYISISNRLYMDDYQRLVKFPIFSNKNAKCLIVDKYYVRERPYGEIAKRTIGYVGRDTLKPVRVGLEGAYDTCLAGKYGVQMRRRVSGGAYIDMDAPVNVAPRNGRDVYTTIDMEMQDIAEDALRRCLIDNEAEQGCVVMMEVETGNIEVMASLTLNKETKKYEESLNFAISGNMEPGSTFKAITMTAILENDPDFNINRVLDIGTSGKMLFGKKYMKDTHPIGNGKVTVKRAFWESSNIAFAYLADEAFSDNPQQFIDLIKKTKINEPLNLDLMGEGVPYIKDAYTKGWSDLSIPWMAIGYELMVTPMTLLTYYNAIANNGRMMKPRFVREIRDGNEVVCKLDPVVINESIASERTVKTLQALLRGVVENGTAKVLNTSCFPVAGKTGTSQISVKGKGYNKENYTASFVGYFPADNPKYTCIVVVRNPMAGKYYGASVSAPVFKEISERVYATELGITNETRQYPSNCDKYTKASLAYYDDVSDYCKMAHVRMADSELGSEWVKVKPSVNGGVAIRNINLKQGVVPDFTGMNVTDAVYLIETMGWKAAFSGFGTVEKQSAEAGEELQKGKTINLILK